MSRIFNLSLIIIFSFSITSANTGTDNRFFDNNGIYKIIYSRLEECLSSSNRFELLPNNIISVNADPSREPIFSLGKYISFCPTSPIISKTYNKLRLPHDQFRLLINERVIGSSESGEIVISDSSGVNTLRVFNNDVVSLKIPAELNVCRAEFVAGHWFVRSNLGYVSEQNGHSFSDLTSSMNVNNSIIFEGTNNNSVIMSLDIKSEKNGFSPLSIGLADKNGFHSESFNVPFTFLQGTVLLDNGCWLAVGNRLAVLNQDFSKMDLVTLMETALHELENNNREKVKDILSQITIFENQDFNGFSHLVKRLSDDRQPNLKAITETANTLSGLLCDSLKTENLPCDDQFSTSLEKYAKETSRFLEKMNSADLNSFFPSNEDIARYVSHGWQFYDGYWIRNPRLVKQVNESEVVLLLDYVDTALNKTPSGLFYIRSDGNLHKIALPDKFQLTGMNGFSSCVGNNGEILIHFRGVGLAAVKEDRLFWINQSERMKSFGSLAGCDQKGCVYFKDIFFPGNGITSQIEVFWVFNRKNTATSSPDIISFPVQFETLATEKSGLWFIGLNNAFDKYNPREKLLAMSDLSWSNEDFFQNMSNCVHNVPLEFSDGSGNAFSISSDKNVQHCLFNFSNKKINRYFNDHSLSRAKLVQGKNGSVFVMNRELNQPGYLVRHNVVTRFVDYHEAAQTQFDFLMSFAPEKIKPNNIDSLYRCFGFNNFLDPAICKTGDVLWINSNNRLEAYRAGKPLLVSRRLILESGALSKVGLLGTLNGNKPGVTIITKENSIRGIFSAEVNADGISLNRFFSA